MPSPEKPFPIGFASVEGNAFPSISAPRFHRRRYDDAGAGLLHCAAVRQHSIILLFIRFIPRKIQLRRKKRRQQEADVCGFSHRISEAQLGEAFLRRHEDDSSLVGRIHHAAAHGERSAAKEADHADALVPEDGHHFPNHLRMVEAHLVVDVQLVLGVRCRQDFIRLFRIRPARIEREGLDFVSFRPHHGVQGFQAALIRFLLRSAKQHGDLLLFSSRKTVRLRLVLSLQKSTKLLRLHALVVRRHMPLFVEQGVVPQIQCTKARFLFARFLLRAALQETRIAEMMDERVVAKKEVVARLQDAQGVVIVFEVAWTELLVEPADLFKHFPLEKIAEAHERRFLLPAHRIGRLVVFRRKELHLRQVAIGDLDLLVVRAGIRDAACGADLRAAVKGTAQILQPILRDNRVTVEKQQFRPRRDGKALIAAFRES